MGVPYYLENFVNYLIVIKESKRLEMGFAQQNFSQMIFKLVAWFESALTGDLAIGLNMLKPFEYS